MNPENRNNASRIDRRALLERICRLYDAFIQSYPVACQRGCTACCTRNVTLTSLEARSILEHLQDAARRDLLERFVANRDYPCFQPFLSLNAVADRLESGEDIPEESADAGQGNCPLLEGGACTIYPFRPFMCRSMVSETPCRELGHAAIKPFALTLAHVLMQYIEHLDVQGFSGNIRDVFLKLAETDGSLLPAELPSPAFSPRIVLNRPLRRLMVPPEHREQIQRLLTPLFTGTSEDPEKKPG